jgi:hypothetical protein
MTMKTKLLIVIGALFAIAATEAVKNYTGLPLARITVKVVDEQQNPIAGANVRLYFQDSLTGKDASVQGPTNSEGLFSGEGGSNPSGVGSLITKEGFYPSGAPLPKYYKVDALNHWQPWNETYTTILRFVGSPVPLYAKSSWIEIPAVGQPCGYDLEKGDWVAPQGKGAVADLVFTLERRYDDRQDFDVKAELSFSRPLDGIQSVDLPVIGKNSMFKWSREAPEDGYLPALKMHFARDPKAGFTQSASDGQAYFFRVRTVEKEGRIVSALYGKISGGLQLAPSNSRTSKVKLTYYFNSNSLDRNLEWDIKRNLIQGLSYEETPRDP